MHEQQLAAQVVAEVKKAVVGKDETVVKTLLAILARGHVLLEDIPGVGKTTMAIAFSRALGLSYNRVQFTPDVMPSDLTGFSLYTACSASTEQWTFTGGRPSSASITALLVTFNASSTVRPLIISVAMELVAMAAPQPKVLNLTSVMVSPCILRYIFMISPHLALPTSPMPLASGSSPTFRGLVKWSITFSE